MRIIIFLLLIQISTLKAQHTYFKIDSLGFRIGNNSNGIIVEVPNKTAQELYNQMLDIINKNYDSPDKVIKAKTEGSYIRYEYYQKNIALFKRGLLNMPIYGMTEIEVEFKDNKFRVRSIKPILRVCQDGYYSTGKNFTVVGGAFENSLYSKKLKPKKEMVRHHVKEQIENYYNSYLNNLINLLSKGSKRDDW